MIETKVYNTVKPLFLMVIGGGKATHLTTGNDETLCGREGQYDSMRGDFCAGCHKVADKMETKGETMAENTTTKLDVATDEGKAALEQIDANIERAATLATEDNAEALEELGKETETLVSALAGKGSIKLKTEKRAAWKAAVEGAAERKAAKAEVETVDPKDYSIYAGVTELITDGAARVAEGVNLHLKTSDLAKDIAGIMLDMWVRIPDKNGNPDIMGTSQAARNAASALYAKAGEGFDRNFDTETALTKLQRSVQYQRTDVRAKYLRSLDEDAEERERFAKALEAKPEDKSAAEFIADLYGTALKGKGEIEREKYQARKELTGGSEGEASEGEAEETEAGQPEESAEERVRKVVKKLRTDIKRAKPEEFEELDETAKAEVRGELEELYEALRKMITATL